MTIFFPSSTSPCEVSSPVQSFIGTLLLYPRKLSCALDVRAVSFRHRLLRPSPSAIVIRIGITNSSPNRAAQKFRRGTKGRPVEAQATSDELQTSSGTTAADAAHMRRAVELARQALGKTSPNPMVGCVIVKDGVVVGEGFHPKAGEPHAEVLYGGLSSV